MRRELDQIDAATSFLRKHRFDTRSSGEQRAYSGGDVQPPQERKQREDNGQRDGGSQPVVIRKGERMRWRNADIVEHNVVTDSVSLPEFMTTGLLAPGGERSFIMNTIGTTSIHCTFTRKWWDARCAVMMLQVDVGLGALRFQCADRVVPEDW